MTEPKKVPETELILYGLDDEAKPRAAIAPNTESEAARALAANLNLQALSISTPQQPVIAAELAPLDLSESGYSALPVVKRALLAQIEALAQAGDERGEHPKASTVGPGVDRCSAELWNNIKVGQLVLSQEDNPKHGWWEAIVVHELEDGELLLRYRDYSPQSRFVRRRDQVALLKAS